MWCTQCHTAFDWKTRQIIKNRIHNPHYFDYVHSQTIPSSRLERTPCQETLENRLPRIHQLQHYFRQSRQIQSYSTYFLDILRALLHLSDVEIHRYPILSDEELFRYNMILRIQYLKKELSEKMFKTMLVRDEKQRDKNKAIHLLFEMLLNTFISIFQELFTYSSPQDIETSILVQIQNLHSYVNQQLDLIHRNFNCRKMILTDTFLVHVLRS
jgi:hypothetical protein